MEHEKIIFLRNVLFRAFIIGVVVALFLLVVTFAFWSTWSPRVIYLFQVDEKELGRIVLVFFMNVRLVLVFLFLVPALALHWTAKKN